MAHSEYPKCGPRDRIENDERNSRNRCMQRDIDVVLTRFIEWSRDDVADLQCWFSHILRKYDLPSDGYDCDFVSNLAFCGWFIFADYVLAPKFHRTRCVVDLEKWEVGERLLTLEKRAASCRDVGGTASRDGQIKWSPLLKCLRKIFNGTSHYEISLNSAFSAALQQTNTFQKATVGVSWAEGGIAAVLEQLRDDASHVSDNGIQSLSWELWNGENELVAADIGLRVGAVYSSLTGFSNRQYSSIGIVQLVAEALLLKKLGFKIWDLGMEMPYKLDLGGKRLSGLEYRTLFSENKFKAAEGRLMRTPLLKLSGFLEIESELMKRRELRRSRGPKDS